MTVYLDVLFFINGLMDFLVLTLLSAIFGYRGTVKNRVLASILGGVLACLVFVLRPYQNGMAQAFSSLLISGIMVMVAYGFCGIKGFIKRLLCLYLIAYGFGGAILWFFQETKGGYFLLLLMRTTSIRNLYLKSFLFISIGVFFLLLVLFGIGKMAKEEQQFLYPVTLLLEGGVVHTIGLLDTGNRLREPRTGRAVLVGELDSLYKGLKKETAEWLLAYFEGRGEREEEKKVPEELYWIPFSSVGKKEGKLPAVCCDRVIVAKNGEMEKGNVFVAITNQRLSPTKEYFLLLHTDLWKE